MHGKKKQSTRQERGAALIMSLFALLLLSAIAASMVLMTNTETSVNANFRKERVADFAAKAGFEEVKDRMRLPNVPNPPFNSISASLPAVLPPGNNSILYLINDGGQAGTVQPWTFGSTYADDELCHDGYNLAFPSGQSNQNTAPDVRCTSYPAGGGWLAASVNSNTGNVPFNNTTASIPYKWVRVALKVNGTEGYVLNNAAQGYWVNPLQYVAQAQTQVCWNGSNELLLPVGTANCQAMTPSTNPVYVITSMGVSGTGSTRKIVQADVALDPAQPFPYGLYATGTACPALNFAGGGNSNPATDSFTTANGGTYQTTNTPSGGDVGANGGVLLNGHAQVGGAIGVVSLTNPSLCNFAQGDYSTQGGQAGPYNTATYPTNIPQTVCPTPPCAGIVFPTPPDPIPAPPSTPYAGNNTLVPGTYGAITTTSDLTLAPGTYNIYSLNMSGQSSIVVNPPGAVVLNFPSASATPISFTGQSITASSNVANNLQINYGGTGTLALAGKADSVMNVNAPNATVNVSGKGDLYGRVVGSTLDWSGNGKFHFDKASALQPQNNGFYRTISFREVSY